MGTIVEPKGFLASYFLADDLYKPKFYQMEMTILLSRAKSS